MTNTEANRVFRLTLTAVVSVVLAVFLAGCNSSLPDSVEQLGRESGHTIALQQLVDPYLAETTPGDRGYKIGPSDVLDVTIYKAPELSRSVQVGTDGMISLPLIGDVRVVNKTPSAVEREVAGKYGAGFLKSPHITVFVKEYNSSRVTVDGAVRQPGVYPTRGHDTLSGAISLAHGLDPDAASSDVAVVHRDNDGKTTMTRYNLSDIHHGRSNDPIVHAGDVIIVEDSTAKWAFHSLKQVAPLLTPLTWVLVNL